MADDKKYLDGSDLDVDERLAQTISNTGAVHVIDYDPVLSKRIARKFDLHLLLLLASMYLCNSLDKTNLGNAKTDGFDKDIGLHGDQYYQLITAFYAPFCCMGIPITILAKRFSPARVLPIMTLTFGGLSMCSAAVKNFGGILAIRMLLAVSESACLPIVVFYLSTFYTRAELASRVGIFYAAASIAGAFGGLIAYGVFQIPLTHLKNWQVLFLIEGGITIFVGICLALFLPVSVAKSRFLTPEEKEMGRLRLLRDSTSEVDSKLDVKGAFKTLLTRWQSLMWISIELTLGVPLASVSNFLPQIVARLGFSTVRTNLLTVAPNVLGALCLVGITQSSDYFRERSIHLFTPLAVTFIGFIILSAIDPIAQKGVSYFATFLMAAGSFTPSVLLTSWAANNTADESQRAVLVAVVVAFGNAAGLISSNIFRAQDEPKYTLALAISAAFGGVSMVLTVIYGVYMRSSNKLRNSQQRVSLQAKDVDTAILKEGSRNPTFRWMY